MESENKEKWHSKQAMKEWALQFDVGLKLLQVVYLGMFISVMGCGLLLSFLVYLQLEPISLDPLSLVGTVLLLMIVFTYGYILGLLALRILIPKPKEGLYSNTQTGRPPKEAVLFILNNFLLRLRHSAPFANSLFTTLVRLPPLASIYKKLCGPESHVAYILDPYFVQIGRNTQIGFMSKIVPHVFDNRGLMLKRVKIGDHVVIGVNSLILAGVEIGNHSTVKTCSVVYPNTIIPPHELWGGNPAKKIKDIGPAKSKQRIADIPGASQPPEGVES